MVSKWMSLTQISSTVTSSKRVDLVNLSLLFGLTFFIAVGSLSSMEDDVIVDVDQRVSACSTCGGIIRCTYQHGAIYHHSTEPQCPFGVLGSRSKYAYALGTHKCLKMSCEHLDDERSFKEAFVLLQGQ